MYLVPPNLETWLRACCSLLRNGKETCYSTFYYRDIYHPSCWSSQCNNQPLHAIKANTTEMRYVLGLTLIPNKPHQVYLRISPFIPSTSHHRIHYQLRLPSRLLKILNTYFVEHAQNTSKMFLW